jgi:hypothetical protein
MSAEPMVCMAESWPAERQASRGAAQSRLVCSISYFLSTRKVKNQKPDQFGHRDVT